MTSNSGIEKGHFDNAVRPQDDFFRHVNGGWLNSASIPDDKSFYGSFYQLADNSEAAVKEILDEAAANPKPGVSQQIGDLYSSFLDEARINELGAAPIEHDLRRIANLETIDQATELLGEYERAGIAGIFGFYVEPDPGNPERYLLNLMQAGLGLPDEAYYREPKHAEILDAYRPHVAQMLQLAGFEPHDADLAATKIVAFETALASKHWNVVDSRDAHKTYNLTTREELQKLTPTFDWNLWLAGSKVDAKVLAETVVQMPSFFEGLASVYNQGDLEVVKLWLAWQVVRSSASYLSDEFVDERFAFYGTKLSGTPTNRARWKRAVTLVEGGLGEAVGQIYVEKHFPPAAKERMDELVEYLIQAYRESILQLDWMSEETKAKALVKLSKFTPKIGYPAKFKDYSSIAIRRDDLVSNVRHISAFVLNTEMSKIGKPIDRDEWFMTPQTVNAYYYPNYNEIAFPAAILQPPFFFLNADDAANFGAIGSVIGHEIGHGFDDQGSKFDGDGALISWWTDADQKAFDERAKKLIDQFSALSPKQLDENHKVNGELTIGENIGDLGGMMIAFRAYQISLKGKQPDVIDSMSAAERFFYAFAAGERGKGRDEAVIQRLATDPHSPPEFRVNQVVRNFDAFHETFNVQPGDAMYLAPEDRVKIW
ncbi:MAG: hypothetical protein RL556_583 [Actinomycetota bacterium]|jgi:putative endopeptidase